MEFQDSSVPQATSGYDLPRRFIGKHVLITGASTGIGRAAAIRFAQEGATVVINYASSDRAARETLALVSEASRAIGQSPVHHRVVKVDVGEEVAARRMVEELVSDGGRLDVLVNNAGIQIEADSAVHAIADVRRVLAVNLMGAFVCSQAAIRHFLSRPGGGVIVNCSSVHQIVPKPGFVGYSMSKGGLGNLTRTLALEYADRGIRVNAVAPGAILTPINDAWRNDPQARADVEAHIPMGRAGTPEEIAAVFAFLASDEASYITGQTIYACGGLTLHGDFKRNWSS
jgi:glucose 1-dehydrogenase